MVTIFLLKKGSPSFMQNKIIYLLAHHFKINTLNRFTQNLKVEYITTLKIKERNIVHEQKNWLYNFTLEF